MMTTYCKLCGHMIVEMHKGRIVGCEHYPAMDEALLTRREKNLASAAEKAHRRPESNPDSYI